MSAAQGGQARALSTLAGLTRFRYLKFGLVGASGTVVNIAVLYLCHEYLFQAIEGPQGKPWASLAVAIAVATVNNFTWNRLWTWADRVQAQRAAAARMARLVISAAMAVLYSTSPRRSSAGSQIERTADAARLIVDSVSA